MPVAKDRLVEAALDLAWSHWVGLGVRGTAPPPNTEVDPEALLYFTAILADHDPRLREEATDWWRQYERHISRPRLRALGARFGAPATTRLHALLEAFQSTTRTSGKSRLDHLATPARSLLRLRCAFGANARAEVLFELVTRGLESDHGLTALNLADVGYTKRNIAILLEDLALSGLVVATREGNRVRYRVADPKKLALVLQPLPTRPGHWHFRLPILGAFVELADRIRGRDAVVQGIEAKKAYERILPMLHAVGASAPPAASAEVYWPALQRWLIEEIAAIDAAPIHRVPRMIEGVWLPLDLAPERPAQFSNAVLPRISASPLKDAELVCLDLVHGPTVEPANWAWTVVSTAATSTYAHTAGLSTHQPWRFATWDLGTQRTYAVEYEAPLAHEQIARAYGSTAAARARTDHPAVQLRLRRLPDDAGDSLR